MQKIAAVVILFYPTPETIEFIRTYLPFVDKLYAIDNSERKSVISSEIAKFDKITYLHDGENEGIAKRLNQACAWAIQDGFKWLLTMDQDSSFEEEDISIYINCLANLSKNKEIAMAGAKFIEPREKAITCNYKETKYLITSGSIINLNLYKQIGSFDEALFIDQVDVEYCFRSILKGFKIIQFENIFFNHSLGESSVHKSLKSFKNTNRSLHSPVRIYYMIRNYFYLRAKYKKHFASEVSAIKKDILIRIKNNLFYNKKRFSVLKLMMFGIIDFKKNKMGKIEN